MSFTLYRLIGDVIRFGPTAANMSGFAVLLMFPLLIWGLAAGVRRGKARRAVRTRDSYSGAFVVCAGWTWFMAPPLRSWPFKPVKTRGFIPFLLVARPEGLELYQQKYRSDVLIGKLAWVGIRSLGARAVDPTTGIPQGTRMLAIDLAPQGGELSDHLEFFLCSEEWEIVRGDVFDDTVCRLESLRAGVRGAGPL
ncbi:MULTISPECIES: hypothetical protein [Arthrobacter]|uniref:hypothetical protein n=1 Tax=Arthrobacter TaxID=1663 RepID=UPI003139305A